ncbi:MAG: hypothetical protein R3F11_28750 [Verrucomicrobiales bacterium]
MIKTTPGAGGASSIPGDPPGHALCAQDAASPGSPATSAKTSVRPPPSGDSGYGSASPNATEKMTPPAASAAVVMRRC